MPTQLRPADSFGLLEQVVDTYIGQYLSDCGKVDGSLLKAHIVACTFLENIWPGDEEKDRLLDKLIRYALEIAETRGGYLNSWLTEFLVIQLEGKGAGIRELELRLHDLTGSRQNEKVWEIRKCPCEEDHCPGWKIATRFWFDNPGPR